MPNASFRDLCLDAADTALSSRFWSGVLGTTVADGQEGSYLVEARPGAPTATQLWVNKVPEPRIGKTRVHLDLRLSAPDPRALVALGARIVTEPGIDRWWVLADPDGNVFCAFPPSEEAPAPPVPSAPFELNVDCGDAIALGTWWAEQTGGHLRQDEGKPWTYIEGAAGFPWEAWIFDPVPEPKGVKNRMHWDVNLTRPDPSALVAAGALVLREPDEEIRWWILADPEGNEFCAFAPESTV
jgi:hypothetical protein